MHKLYKITNQINGKVYVGITKLELDQRWKQHVSQSKSPKYPLHRAINKHGQDNFCITLLYECDDRRTISEMEEPTILSYDSRENGYNVAKGGYGGDLGDAVNAKRKITISNYSDEVKQRLSDMRRVRQTGQTKHNSSGRKSQSEKLMGNQHALGLKHTDETKRKISEANANKPKSDSTKQKMSDYAISNHINTRFYGRNACCICCQKEWDIGNYTKHIKRNKI